MSIIKNKDLSEELKLVVIPSKKIFKCQLIGLDGDTKLYSKSIFSLKELKGVVNQMPMRKKELERRVNQSGSGKQ